MSYCSYTQPQLSSFHLLKSRLTTGRRPQGSSSKRLSRLRSNALVFMGQTMKAEPGICARPLPFPQAPRAGRGQTPAGRAPSRCCGQRQLGPRGPALLPRSSGRMRALPGPGCRGTDRRLSSGSAGTVPSPTPPRLGRGPLRVTRNRRGWRLRSSCGGCASTHRERGAGSAGGAVPSPARRGEAAQRDSTESASSHGCRRPGKRQHWPSPHRPPLASVSGPRTVRYIVKVAPCKRPVRTRPSIGRNYAVPS